METKVFHGELNIGGVAEALAKFFNRGGLFTQLSQDGNQAFVQIGTYPGSRSGGRTSLGVSLRQVDDRLEVSVGKQAVLGIAASLGASALLALRNPLSLLGRLDDIAQDIENLELDEQVWAVVEQLARDAGASYQLSERLRRLTCEYCRVANPVGEASCLACGAPLGEAQPGTCAHCGYALSAKAIKCPNCGRDVAK
jgi:hypothetical protein